MGSAPSKSRNSAGALPTPDRTLKRALALDLRHDKRVHAAFDNYENLVFEGGGVLGSAYVGVIEVLEEMGLRPRIRRVGGTSAGAMVATGFALGYTAKEFRKFFLHEFDMINLPEGSLIEGPKRVVTDFGWYKTDFLHSVIEGLIARKIKNKRATFAELKRELPDSPELFVTVSNLTTELVHVYSTIHTPQIAVADAIVMSMSLPLFFTAMREPILGDVMVDGGLLMNFPIRLFDFPRYMTPEHADEACKLEDMWQVEKQKAAEKVFCKSQDRSWRFGLDLAAAEAVVGKKDRIAALRTRERRHVAAPREIVETADDDDDCNDKSRMNSRPEHRSGSGSNPAAARRRVDSAPTPRRGSEPVPRVRSGTGEDNGASPASSPGGHSASRTRKRQGRAIKKRLGRYSPSPGQIERHLAAESSEDKEDEVYNARTLGFRVDSRDEISKLRDDNTRAGANTIDSLYSFANALLSTISTSSSYVLRNRDKQRTVFVDSLDVHLLDFGMGTETLTNLMQSGNHCFRRKILQLVDSGEFDFVLKNDSMSENVRTRNNAAIESGTTVTGASVHSSTASSLSSSSSTSSSQMEVVAGDGDDENDDPRHVHCWNQNWKTLIGLSGTHVRVAPHGGEVALTLKFRTLATLVTVLFVLSIAIGMVVTFTATEYAADRDYVFRFFAGSWSPCTLYDHYPSNVVTLLLSLAWIIPVILFSLALWAVAGLLGDPMLTLGASATCLLHSASACMFLNIFAANLYEHGYHEADEELTDQDIGRVMVHTAWYALYLFGSGALAVLIVHVVRLSTGTLAKSAWIPAASIPLMFYQALYFFMMLSQSKYPFDPKTTLQAVLLWIQKNTHINPWAWVPILVTMFIPPTQMGVKVSVRLEPEEPAGGRALRYGDFELAPRDMATMFIAATPERLFSVAFRILAAVLVGVYAFTDPDGSGDTTLVLASAFRAEPFRYVFIPIWVVIFMLMLVAVALTIARRVLVAHRRRISTGKRPENYKWYIGGGVRRAVLSGIFLLMVFSLSTLLVIPQIKSTLVLFILDITAVLLWILGALADRSLSLTDILKMSLYWSVLLVAGAGSAIATDVSWNAGFNAALCLWLCVFEFFMPTRTPLQWRLQALGVSRARFDVST